MLFFVFIYSCVASYFLLFFIPKYIEKINKGSELNFNLLLLSFVEKRTKKAPSYKNLIIFFTFFFVSLLALDSRAPWQIENQEIRLTVCFIWIISLTSLAKIDLRSGFIPNTFTYPLWAIGCLIQLSTAESAWSLSIIPSIFFLLSGQIFHTLYFNLKGKSPFGMGDIKLLAVLCCWTDLLFSVTTIFLSCGILLIFHKANKKKQRTYPFGPFLLLGVLGVHTLHLLS